MGDPNEGARGCTKGCLLSIFGGVVLSILVLILRQCAGLSNELSDEPETAPPSVETSAADLEGHKARVKKALHVKDPSVSDSVFGMLNEAVTFREQALGNRDQAVAKESADLIKKIAESTGGRFTKEEAIELLDNMTPGQAHDAAMDASQRNIVVAMDRAAKKLQSQRAFPNTKLANEW